MLGLNIIPVGGASDGAIQIAGALHNFMNYDDRNSKDDLGSSPMPDSFSTEDCPPSPHEKVG
jgi:hypothetical protein